MFFTDCHKQTEEKNETNFLCDVYSITYQQKTGSQGRKDE